VRCVFSGACEPVAVIACTLRESFSIGLINVPQMRYSPIVYSTGDIIDTYVYRMSFENAQYSLATAIGLLKSLVSFILIVVSNFCAGKFANYRIF
jgi:ABC-type polysaccharide transport system permease subunit